MFRIFFCLIFIYFISFKTYSQRSLENDYRAAKNILTIADKYTSKDDYKQEKADALYRNALWKYEELLKYQNEGEHIQYHYLIHTDLGFLYNYFDSLPQAKSSYLIAIGVYDQQGSLSDSALFSSLLFLGSIYYRQNNFDSAHYYLKKALNIQDKYESPLPNAQRLYNWLGGMYYETGNYKQAKNYFEKALQILKKDVPYFEDLFIRYKNNIASCLVKLEKYDEADSIYSALLKSKLNTNEIANNLGIVNLKSGRVQKALSYFTQVKFSNALTVTLYNHIGRSYHLLAKKDSADLYYAKALEAHEKWQPGKKSVMHGYTYQYIAERYVEKDEFDMAAEYYQKAINQFYTNYQDTNIFANPTEYSGIFSYMDLFNGLVGKADVLSSKYHFTDQLKYLQGSLETYQSAFKLLSYVERVYESDEARLFLNNIKYKIHDKPIQHCLELFKQTNVKKYLEYAFDFDQKSKSSVLALKMKEVQQKNQSIENALWNEETSIKNKATRLAMKATRILDSAQLTIINNEIRDNEIKLSKIQSQKNDLLASNNSIEYSKESDFTFLQKKINSNTVLVSYHLSPVHLIILCITNKNITYSHQAIDSTFFESIQSYKMSLNPNSTTTKFGGYEYGKKLFQYLITPVADIIKNKTHLIIIPDDELNSLPFESLQDTEGNYLIEGYCIQYQYTALLLSAPIKKSKNVRTILALAPYASQNIKALPRLEYSQNEIENLKGKILLDKEASKQRLLSEINNFSIIHLATHTIIDAAKPENSFISFSPSNINDEKENDLYLPEIYNLNLDSIELVILSSCETGIGKLNKGEGLMSLSRAFSYAGSQNSIASLWKADDKSTAWIIKRFYHYLHRGNTIARSLQNAKTDYLGSSEIENRFKSPDYWAHLVLTGVLENEDPDSTWAFILIGVLLVILMIWIGSNLIIKR